jgi:hypothetical protein
MESPKSAAWLMAKKIILLLEQKQPSAHIAPSSIGHYNSTIILQGVSHGS